MKDKTTGRVSVRGLAVIASMLMAPLVALIDLLLVLLAAEAAVLGGVRFFLTSGPSPRYLMRRKRWFEETVLGRRMRLRDYAQFGAWHAETATRRRWRVRE